MLLLCFSFGAHAKLPETIDVPITVKADNQNAKIAPENTKKTAIYDGQRQAFYAAISKVAPTNAKNIYRALRTEDLSAYLQSYTINREVVSEGAYEADIVYRFNRDKLNTITGAERTVDDNADPTGEGLLILPIYDVGASLLLFERGNQWRYALNDAALEVGQGQMVMPFGDVRDQNITNAQSVVAGEKASLASMARRYGTRNVVIAAAKQGEQSLRVSLNRAEADKGEVINLDFKAEAGETIEGLLQRAAQATAAKLRDSISDYSLFAPNDANKLKAIVLRAEFENGKQWRYMLEAMRSLPNLERLDLGAVGLQVAQATLLYKGEEGVMRAKMLAKMLERGLIIDDSGEYWVVRVPSTLIRSNVVK